MGLIARRIIAGFTLTLQPSLRPCRCLIAPRAWVDGAATTRPNAEREYLNSLSVDNARQVMGGAERLQAMRKGARLDDVLNAGKYPSYHLKRLGEFGEVAKPGMIGDMKKTAYETAQQKDGDHHGWYLQQLKLPDIELERGIRSFRKQIAKHRQWINNPYLKIPDFDNLHPDRKQNLIERKWPQDIERQKNQIAILEGILKERKK